MQVETKLVMDRGCKDDNIRAHIGKKMQYLQSCGEEYHSIFCILTVGSVCRIVIRGRKKKKGRNCNILQDQHYKIHRKYIKEHHKIFGVCLLTSHFIVHYKYNNDWLISSRQRQPHMNC